MGILLLLLQAVVVIVVEASGRGALDVGRVAIGHWGGSRGRVWTRNVAGR